jgi:hypothetical protein
MRPELLKPDFSGALLRTQRLPLVSHELIDNVPGNAEEGPP